MHEHFSSGRKKRLPIAYFGGEGHEICLELLSLVYGESEITPISCAMQESESDDYLSQKYINHVKPMLLEVEGEIIFPLAGMFDSDMFIINYKKFYTL